MSTTLEQANGSAAIEVGSHRAVFPAHIRDLTSSGLSPDTIRAAGLYSEHDRKKLADLVGWQNWPQAMGAALVFPYNDLDGNRVFSRVKPERPKKARNGRPQKYLQPRGVKPCEYYPPGAVEKLLGGSTQVVITEGEKKALCLMQRGFCAIGLSGVRNWQPGGQVSKLLPGLERIEWRGRNVFIAYDSDVTTNQHVLAAEQLLAATLTSRGAIVRVVRIPEGPNGEKQGADDFIVAHGQDGPGQFNELLKHAIEPEEPDPGSLRQSAAELDPAIVAEQFARANSIDGHPRLRFWRGQWWYWHAGGYRELQPEDLRAKLVEFINRDYFKVTRAHVSNTLMQLESISLVGSHLDAPSWIDQTGTDWPPLECVAAKTSILHLPTYISQSSNYLAKATPRFFTTSSLGYKFDPKAKLPELWLAFLDSLWGNDRQSIDTLQNWFGYCLTPDTRHQKALMIVGPKRSGKGTIARVLAELVGRSNVAGPTLSSLATNFGLWPLLGKSLATISDARFSSRVDQATVVERFLSITGEDAVTIDRKLLQPVTCKLPTRFMVLTNELPRLGDASGALASRLIILHTPNSFYGQEDYDLTEKLLAELPGIFCWAVTGWARLRHAGRFSVPDSSQELAGQMADLSSPVSAFVRECCVVGAQYEVEVDELFKCWKAWCEEENHRPGDKARFGRDLAAAVPSIRRARPRVDGRRIQYYAGIALG